MQTTRGFTLVELLVVISIIAILSTIGLVMYDNAQKQARISKRIKDLTAIQTALELYYSVNKTYPVVTLGMDTIFRSECSSWGGYSSDEVIPNPSGYPSFVPTYMSAFPSDPSMIAGSVNQNCYIYRSNGSEYKIMGYNVIEFSQDDYKSQRNLIDTRRDGGTDSCKYEEGAGNIYSWALYSSGGCVY